MPAQLIALTEGASILLDRPILLIGRHPECDIQLDSRKISRRHCCVAQVSDYLVVRDLGSTNGVRINGVRILEGRLRPGDELTIGGLRYQVRWDKPPNVSVDRPPARESLKAQGTLYDPAEVGDLDSLDEPVALPDTNGRKGKSHGVPTPASAPPPMHPAKRAKHEGGILPENLDLAPPSDIFFKPPSHHPAG
jgi:predicted component of type VI protein secretion system